MIAFVTRYYPSCGTADVCRKFVKNFAELREYVRECALPNTDIWNVRITDGYTSDIICEMSNAQISKLVK